MEKTMGGKNRNSMTIPKDIKEICVDGEILTGQKLIDWWEKQPEMDKKSFIDDWKTLKALEGYDYLKNNSLRKK